MSLRRFKGATLLPSSKISRLVFTEEEERRAREYLQSLRVLTPARYSTYLQGLSGSQRTQLNRVIWSLAWKDSSQSLEYFAKYVNTRDEHAPPEHSEKPFPTRIEKPYVWEFLDTVCREDLLACEKSRQLMVTWAMCLYCLWMAKFQKNRIIFVQSKKELDAANLVYNQEEASARISFMESKLPEMLRSEVQWSFGKGIFDSGSWIWGIPEGGDQIRGYSVSLLFSDEFAFQPEAENAWKAASASAKRGGKVVLVSTANNAAYMKTLIERF